VSPARSGAARWAAPLLALLLAASCRPDIYVRGEQPWQEDATLEPWSVSKRAPAVSDGAPAAWRGAAPSAQRSQMLELAFRLYSQHLSRVDGPRCEHRPSCSRYAVEAMRKHGFVAGAWLSVDRLMRAGNSSSLRQLPLKEFHEGNRYYHDPVEENDFFF
jgi:putative component of membrane protein insertase Oxa1/YidC/SpoIIIJ protein YidD